MWPDRDEEYLMPDPSVREAMTQKDAIRAYKVILNGNASGADRDHFIKFFNWLLINQWSKSGLRWIKEQAWKP